MEPTKAVSRVDRVWALYAVPSRPATPLYEHQPLADFDRRFGHWLVGLFDSSEAALYSHHADSKIHLDHSYTIGPWEGTAPAFQPLWSAPLIGEGVFASLRLEMLPVSGVADLKVLPNG